MNLEALWLIPAAPLAGSIVLLAAQGRMPQLPAALIGAGSVGLSAFVALSVALAWGDAGHAPYAQTLWTWIDVGGFTPRITLYLDGLSLVMVGVITGVGFLIHLYATGYMAGEEGYCRFFAYMNLFVFAMLMLVLGDNLLVLYLGWEGVGLCSYLLIGFFHLEDANGYAARKAFVVTRIGDVAMALGLFLLYRELGTLEIGAIADGARAAWGNGSPMCTLAALLLLGGAVGKSAQIPLQTWLPDAMAGPTPVSALIHAATMVTAGVYLVARMHALYVLAPTAQLAVAVVGAATLFVAALAALTQRDIKRILAYSTMSQIGYMFMALGVGAWSAAIFHLMTHAFFKALLFLAAGSVISALHHEQNIYRMGGLWRRLPIPFACMVIGSAALSALPLTSGFYSKDEILLASFAFGATGPWFWAIGSAAALLTALYSMRMIVVVFFGAQHHETSGHDGLNMTIPLVVLALLAIGGGWFGLTPVAAVLPDGGAGAEHGGVLALVTMAIPVLGVVAGWLLFTRRSSWAHLMQTPLGEGTRRLLSAGLGFDAIYDALFVRPFVALARLNRNDVIDGVYVGIAALSRSLHRAASATQTGHLRWYAVNMALGVALMLLLAIGG